MPLSCHATEGASIYVRQSICRGLRSVSRSTGVRRWVPLPKQKGIGFGSPTTWMAAEAVGPVTKRTATGSPPAFPALVLQMEKQTHTKRGGGRRNILAYFALGFFFFFGFGLAAKLTKRLFAESCSKLDGQLRSCQRSCCCLAEAGAAAESRSCCLWVGWGRTPGACFWLCSAPTPN